MIAWAIVLVAAMGIIMGGILALRFLHIKEETLRVNRRRMAALQAKKQAKAAAKAAQVQLPITPPGDHQIPPWVDDLLARLKIDEDTAEPGVDLEALIDRYSPIIQQILASPRVAVPPPAPRNPLNDPENPAVPVENVIYSEDEL